LEEIGYSNAGIDKSKLRAVKLIINWLLWDTETSFGTKTLCLLVGSGTVIMTI